jgi:hypothetical protein
VSPPVFFWVSPASRPHAAVGHTKIVLIFAMTMKPYLGVAVVSSMAPGRAAVTLAAAEEPASQERTYHESDHTRLRGADGYSWRRFLHCHC